MTQRRLGVGIIGGGFVGRFHIRSFVGVRDADVLGVVSRRGETAEEAAALARHANKADIIAGMDFSDEPPEVANILIDLAQRETMNMSARYAQSLVAELSGQVRLLNRPHRFAGFAVLKAPDVPSVLFELGFMSNESDETLLHSAQHRRVVVEGIRRSLDRYFPDIRSASR